MITGEVYLVTNKVNNKKYVGQTVNQFPSGRKYSAKQRWRRHVTDAKKGTNGCTALANAIRKYGEESFIFEVLIKCPKSELDSHEKRFIQEYQSVYPTGYNIEDGGKKCKGLHADTRKTISESRRYKNIDPNNLTSIKDAMKTLQMNELPMGMQYTSTKSVNIEGFVVQLEGHQTMRFTAKSLSLTEKLQEATEYYKLCTNGEDTTNFKDKIDKSRREMISKQKRPKVNHPEVEEALKILNIECVPQYIRYEKRKSRFYVKFPNSGCKYFTAPTVSESLELAIEYKNANDRNGSRSEGSPQPQ